jgi:hypothetical protein
MKDMMRWVTKMFEGQFVFGRPYPAIVACVVGLIAAGWPGCHTGGPALELTL